MEQLTRIIYNCVDVHCVYFIMVVHIFFHIYLHFTLKLIQLKRKHNLHRDKVKTQAN